MQRRSCLRSQGKISQMTIDGIKRKEPQEENLLLNDCLMDTRITYVARVHLQLPMSKL